MSLWLSGSSGRGSRVILLIDGASTIKNTKTGEPAYKVTSHLIKKPPLEGSNKEVKFLLCRRGKHHTNGAIHTTTKNTLLKLNNDIYIYIYIKLNNVEPNFEFNFLK